MNRRVVAVLALTFCALVAATVWVPARISGLMARYEPWPPRTQYMAVWNLRDPGILHESPLGAGWGASSIARSSAQIHLPTLATELAAIVVIGGLLALFFRTRAARGAA